jgi:hypothetical protein
MITDTFENIMKKPFCEGGGSVKREMRTLGQSQMALRRNSFSIFTVGEFHDQGDAKSIVIRRPLRGHNDTPFGRATSGQPIGRPGVGHSQGVFGVF